ncbi:hypothetical protein Y032_0179g740 [Ancylostoma ceylanicum]|uniref:Uncharacterized protein n=1 Tax=Ancylostoma ceylanicum TaxID=53326 RepID=A0A016STV2_9BILA|nr:hypothetical protein Y032_0179g740 [Ancylostoma ceylanicum]
MSENDIDREIDAMLNLEQPDDRRVSELQAQVSVLMEQVRNLSEKAAQVKTSILTIGEKVAALKELPNALHESMLLGSCTRTAEKTRDEVVQLAHVFADQNCEAQLTALAQVVDQLEWWNDLDWEKITTEHAEVLEQARHDEDCIRQLAQLWNVKTSDVLHTAQQRIGELPTTSNSCKEYPRNKTGIHAKTLRNGSAQYSCLSSQKEQPMELDHQPRDNDVDFRSAMRQVRENEHVHPAGLAPSDEQRASRGQFSNRGPMGECEPTVALTERSGGYLNLQSFQNWRQPVQPPPTREQRSQGEIPPPLLQNTHDSGLALALATMALPDVQPFSNPQGKGFETCLTSFHMKYGKLGLDHSMLTHLLSSKLEGHPRAIFDALPRSCKEDSFTELVETLRERLRENDASRRTEAYVKLKQLRKTTSVTKYCVKLSHKPSIRKPAMRNFP